ncbi:unnamed protein product [Linum tenue]|uniref:Uncharacterized protein n=1 Tax=Linum tenue TaxID=586396 RepID=A0AAV0QQ87_9ROSI|nr:unnamed protein product [Linum tenue]
MPQELPGFYYDAEKNRYFPLKGPIPGSSRASSSSSSSSYAADRKNPKQNTSQADKYCRTRVKTHRLLQGRELNGNVVSVSKSKYNFVQEYQKAQASQPVVWRYQEPGELACDGGLDQTSFCIQKPDGQVNMDILVAGGINGCLRVTTLGSETSNSTVCLLKFMELEEYGVAPSRIASMSCTIWTADCNSNAREAVIGNSYNSFLPYCHTKCCFRTNLGAALVNLETGIISWLCRSKSDVLSQQLNKAGNVVLCGLRNGAILSVDTREKQGHSGRRSHRVQSIPLGNRAQHRASWFRVEGNIDPATTVCMPSSVCSLVSLQLYDQYFLASSMDGAIKLYDHRLTNRGAVQVYEGHVNSHTRLQLKVDPSERFLMAGGEDCHLRLWSVKSGKLLFDEKVSDAVPSTVCWQKGKLAHFYFYWLLEAATTSSGDSKSVEECSFGVSPSFRAWCGSRDGLIYTCWP